MQYLTRSLFSTFKLVWILRACWSHFRHTFLGQILGITFLCSYWPQIWWRPLDVSLTSPTCNSEQLVPTNRPASLPYKATLNHALNIKNLAFVAPHDILAPKLSSAADHYNRKMKMTLQSFWRCTLCLYTADSDLVHFEHGDTQCSLLEQVPTKNDLCNSPE